MNKCARCGQIGIGPCGCGFQAECSPIKGYVVWNYWDHVIVLVTAIYQDAHVALVKLRADRPHIGYDWSGIEAVDDIAKVPAHLVQPYVSGSRCAYLEDIAHKRENYKMDQWSFAS